MVGSTGLALQRYFGDLGVPRGFRLQGTRGVLAGESCGPQGVLKGILRAFSAEYYAALTNGTPKALSRHPTTFSRDRETGISARVQALARTHALARMHVLTCVSLSLHRRIYK